MGYVKQEDLVLLEKRLYDAFMSKVQEIDNFAYENHKANSNDIDTIIIAEAGEEVTNG